MQILSYGGGVQTAALAVLNATGAISPRADLAVFADTGAEMPGTLKHIEVMRPWLADRGIEIVTIHNDYDGPLPDYIRERACPIPVHFKGGIGRRQCTSKWKVEPIEKWLRTQGTAHATVQLGISLDEFHRAKDSRTKWVTNRFPLIEQRLTRRDCRRILENASLPIPPRSSCYFCPFHTQAAWQVLAVYHPSLFDEAAELEKIVNARRYGKMRGEVFFSSRLVPLRRAFSKHQLPLPFAEMDELCGGYCWT